MRNEDMYHYATMSDEVLTEIINLEIHNYYER